MLAGLPRHGRGIEEGVGLVLAAAEFVGGAEGGTAPKTAEGADDDEEEGHEWKDAEPKDRKSVV